MLIVEDDERIGSTLLRALQGNGYDASRCTRGADALGALQTTRVDLVLLDLGLPDMDGVDVCRKIRDIDSSVPIVMLTARSDELDVVVGLDAGAIDYVSKPFKLAELMARIRAQLRQTPTRPKGRAVFGDLSVDGAARRVWIGDEEVVLRAKEFDLLVRLSDDAGTVVSREALMADVWDEHWFGSTKTLDFHISALRRRIDSDDRPSRITTLRGVGYRFEAP